MAQGDPPVYQLVDSNGNVQAELRHDLAQSLIIDTINGNDVDFQQSDLSNIQSISTDDLTAVETNHDYQGGSGWDNSEVLNEYGSSASIDDDFAATFFPNAIRSVTLSVTVSQGSNTGTALIGGSSLEPDCYIVSQGGDVMFETATSTLGGTTGTDGVVTVSIYDNGIDFENRTGGAARFEVSVKGDAITD